MTNKMFLIKLKPILPEVKYKIEVTKPHQYIHFTYTHYINVHCFHVHCSFILQRVCVKIALYTFGYTRNLEFLSLMTLLLQWQNLNMRFQSRNTHIL